MWLLADAPLPFSDGVCAFLGNGPSLFWLRKSKPFMLWSGKNATCVCSTRGYFFLCRGKKGKPTASCTVSVICVKKGKTHNGMRLVVSGRIPVCRQYPGRL